MAYDYDALYAKTPDALGPPTDAFTRFFRSLDARQLSVLDLGCGQGRDALFIARLGHRVTGVDLSPHGIADLVKAAARERLAVQGLVADLQDYAPDGRFDIIVLDRTLHMLEETPRLAVLERMLDHVAAGGWMLIADERAHIAAFEQIIAGHAADWETVFSKPGYLFIQNTCP